MKSEENIFKERCSKKKRQKVLTLNENQIFLILLDFILAFNN